MGRYARHQLDANHKEIRAALEAVGATCDHRSPGDLEVGYRGRTYTIEVKTKTGKLRPSQERFRARWQGHYAVVRTVDEALREIGVIR